MRRYRSLYMTAHTLAGGGGWAPAIRCAAQGPWYDSSSQLRPAARSSNKGTGPRLCRLPCTGVPASSCKSGAGCWSRPRSELASCSWTLLWVPPSSRPHAWRPVPVSCRAAKMSASAAAAIETCTHPRRRAGFVGAARMAPACKAERNSLRAAKAEALEGCSLPAAVPGQHARGMACEAAEVRGHAAQAGGAWCAPHSLQPLRASPAWPPRTNQLMGANARLCGPTVAVSPCSPKARWTLHAEPPPTEGRNRNTPCRHCKPPQKVSWTA